MTPTSTRLAICLWDFTWYTRTGPGEPFEDLDRACQETVDRGFNAIRICAMPFLLFGSGLDTSRLRLGPLPGGHGQRTRWYDVKHETTIDAREHLLNLFRACERHNLSVIVSSWEYQQSPSFALDDSWYRALYAVPPEDRLVALAEAEAALLDFLGEHDLAHLVVFSELHNEVATGHLTDGLPGPDLVVQLHDRLARGVERFHQLRPNDLCAANYSRVPVGQMRGIPDSCDVLVCHPYIYGVLDELIHEFGLRSDSFDPDRIAASGLVRADAGPYPMPGTDSWRFRATIMRLPEMWVHDNVDAVAWDAWLYGHLGSHLAAMYDRLDLWLDAAHDWAVEHDARLVFAEGWVGYTPLEGTFEEGPIGRQIILHAMRRSGELDAWGTMVCSNAAPHHPMWADRDFISEANAVYSTTAPAGSELAPAHL